MTNDEWPGLRAEEPVASSNRRGASQSQRDCVPQPWVARHELPWVDVRWQHNPEGVASLRRWMAELCSRRRRLQILLARSPVHLAEIHLVPQRDYHQLLDQGLLPGLATYELIHRRPQLLLVKGPVLDDLLVGQSLHARPQLRHLAQVTAPRHGEALLAPGQHGGGEAGGPPR